MQIKQRTIKTPVSISGTGLHTGVQTTITFKPAPENHGYVFQRIDVEGKPIIHALAENVTDTARGTTIEENGTKVSTIEHVLASLVGLSIDNVLMEIDGPEAPIMDGSAIKIVEALKTADVEEQKENRKYYVIKEKIVFSDEEHGVDIIAYPDDYLSINVLIDYNSPVLGNQYATIKKIEDFEPEVAPCRTFVFFSELEGLAAKNLIKGGDLDNAIVLINKHIKQDEINRVASLFHKQANLKPNENGVLNNIDLRFPNEPARHKLLDIIGDMALIGRPIRGKIVATRPGHYANTEFAKKIRQVIKKEEIKDSVPRFDPNIAPIHNINDIKKLLPHRYPFLLVDRVTEMTESSIVAIKNVSSNEPFFQGHFPEEPVMPGVLIMEAMAQVGGLLVLANVENPEQFSTYFLKMDKVKFRKKVVPGDTLVFSVEFVAPIRRGIAHIYGRAYVGDACVAEGELVAQVVKNK